MRRFLIIPLLALSLVGCAGLPSFEQIKTVATLGTATVDNPITEERLNTIERGIIVVFAGLNAWKKSCKEGLINATCKEQIRAVQVYTRQIPPYLTRLRQFVRNNDQVNARVVWNELAGIISIIKTKAAEAGQPIQEG